MSVNLLPSMSSSQIDKYAQANLIDRGIIIKQITSGNVDHVGYSSSDAYTSCSLQDIKPNEHILFLQVSSFYVVMT